MLQSTWRTEWEWNPQTQCYERLCCDPDGLVRQEKRATNLEAVKEHVHAQERRRNGLGMNMERIAAIPPVLITMMLADGIPFYDMDEGPAAAFAWLKKNAPNYLTVAAKGM